MFCFIFILLVVRVVRMISELAVFLFGWMMDSYVFGKYSWKRVKIMLVLVNKFDSS